MPHCDTPARALCYLVTQHNNTTQHNRNVYTFDGERLKKPTRAIHTFSFKSVCAVNHFQAILQHEFPPINRSSGPTVSALTAAPPRLEAAPFYAADTIVVFSLCALWQPSLAGFKAELRHDRPMMDLLSDFNLLV